MRIGSINRNESAGNLPKAGMSSIGMLEKGKRFRKFDLDVAGAKSQGHVMAGETMLSVQPYTEDGKRNSSSAASAAGEQADDRGEAAKIYEAVRKGEENPIKNLRSVSKVPYGHLAKDGVIDYKGVVFVCDERTNSICLGDMTDEKNVLNITLSGGGHLKVNRNSLGQLSKAIGMFSPEDVNLIMRAIHQDTKIQSMQKEIEDLEDSVGGLVNSGE